MAVALLAGALTGPVTAAHAGTVPDPASLVNPFVMTSNGGNTFPGADLPHGMLQWSPDTAPNRSKGGNYDYHAKKIRGYALTHMSGPGCGAMGDLPILPVTGDAPPNGAAVNKTLASYGHTGETAEAGYYAGMAGSTRTELTATQRGGMARFTFKPDRKSGILIKLRDSQNKVDASSAKIVGNNEVTGSTTSGHFCGHSTTYTVHFDIVFDRPFTSSKILGSNPDGAWTRFDTTSDPVVQAKVGISFVSTGNATANRTREIPGWSFQAVHDAAHRAWHDALGRIEIGGGTPDQQKLFYTSLYHVLLHPQVVSDSNGQYLGYDHQVHTVEAGQRAHYQQFSGWDIYHGQDSLTALVAPQAAGDVARSMLQAYQQRGYFPKWGFMNSETYVMIGDPADAIIANYHAFGARGFDVEATYSGLLAQATTDNKVRPFTSVENRYGYFPDDLPYNGCCSFNGKPAELIEYGQADFALSRLALAAGDRPNADVLTRRANNWKHIANPATRLLQNKLANGHWLPTAETDHARTHYVEGSAGQYRFQVPFNQPALARVYGGNATFNKMLDGFFTSFANSPSRPGANLRRSNLANEFDLGTPWYYNWTGAPSHTQQVVHRFLTTLYGNNPWTFPGNDDLGAMSAQYVWGALGIYPATPGSADVALNSPLFTTAVIHLGSGRTLTVNAPEASGRNFYIQSLSVNGAASGRTWLPASTFTNGGTVDITLGATPSTWGTAPGDAPPAYDS